MIGECSATAASRRCSRRLPERAAERVERATERDPVAAAERVAHRRVEAGAVAAEVAVATRAPATTGAATPGAAARPIARCRPTSSATRLSVGTRLRTASDTSAERSRCRRAPEPRARARARAARRARRRPRCRRSADDRARRSSAVPASASGYHVDVARRCRPCRSAGRAADRSRRRSGSASAVVLPPGSTIGQIGSRDEARVRAVERRHVPRRIVVRRAAVAAERDRLRDEAVDRRREQRAKPGGSALHVAKIDGSRLHPASPRSGSSDRIGNDADVARRRLHDRDGRVVQVAAIVADERDVAAERIRRRRRIQVDGPVERVAERAAARRCRPCAKNGASTSMRSRTSRCAMIVGCGCAEIGREQCESSAATTRCARRAMNRLERRAGDCA